jgi:hypothetical protein
MLNRIIRRTYFLLGQPRWLISWYISRLPRQKRSLAYGLIFERDDIAITLYQTSGGEPLPALLHHNGKKWVLSTSLPVPSESLGCNYVIPSPVVEMLMNGTCIMGSAES